MFVFVSDNNIPMGMSPLTSVKTIGKDMQGTHLYTNGVFSGFFGVSYGVDYKYDFGLKRNCVLRVLVMMETVVAGTDLKCF